MFNAIFIIFLLFFADSDAEPLSSKAKKPMRKFGNPSNNIAGSPGLSKRRGGGLSDAGGATDGDYVSEMKQGANNIMVSFLFCIFKFYFDV